MLHKGTNITALFAEHLKLQEKSISTEAYWVNSSESK